jgi:hypothetical protein
MFTFFSDRFKSVSPVSAFQKLGNAVRTLCHTLGLVNILDLEIGISCQVEKYLSIISSNFPFLALLSHSLSYETKNVAKETFL